MPQFVTCSRQATKGKNLMSFRKPKSDEHDRSRRWNVWIDTNRSTLASIGLSPSVYLDEARWQDFLQNGHLDWHPDPTGFGFEDLSKDQLARLGDFLESEYGRESASPPLLGWIRVRRGMST